MIGFCGGGRLAREMLLLVVLVLVGKIVVVGLGVVCGGCDGGLDGLWCFPDGVKRCFSTFEMAIWRRVEIGMTARNLATAG